MDRQWKIGIGAGVIANLLVIIFFQPILNILWRLILSEGEAFHQGWYVDRIYRHAARAGGNPYGELTFLVLSLSGSCTRWIVLDARQGKGCADARLLRFATSL